MNHDGIHFPPCAFILCCFSKLVLLEREKHDLILDVQERVRALKVNKYLFTLYSLAHAFVI